MACVCVLKLQYRKNCPVSTKERLQNSINMRKKLCLETEQLGNMDEVPLTFDVSSNKTVDVKGARKL